MSDYGKGNTAWFTHDRFGMFIHFGLYSMAARHEWVRHHERLTIEDYQKYFDRFDPDMIDPAQWARDAKNAGMKYFVITTKHHEGFCLWDTKYTDYKITNTPFGRDLLREVVDAFRAEGLKIGLYYSLLDWHHPDFTIDHNHPLRGYTAEQRAEYNKGRDMKRYAQYMRDQVTELLTNYGKIDVLWFDFSYPREDGKGHDDWESEKLIRLVRSLQSEVIVDNRLDLPGSGDVTTPEQYMPDTAPVDASGAPVVWEGCHTFSGSWGYFRDEMSWKSPEMCIEMLVNHVALGGNLLMNVGPTSRGYMDTRALNCLKAYGEWMKYNSRAIYGCGAAPAELQSPRDCRLTYNRDTNRLYVHCFAWPFKHLTLKGFGGKIAYAQLLADGSEIKFCDSENSGDTMNQATAKGDATLSLPVKVDHLVAPLVIELFLK